MSYWWVDRFLPGALAGLLVTAVVALSHIRLRRHITQLTEDQTAELKKHLSSDPNEGVCP